MEQRDISPELTAGIKRWDAAVGRIIADLGGIGARVVARVGRTAQREVHGVLAPLRRGLPGLPVEADDGKTYVCLTEWEHYHRSDPGALSAPIRREDDEVRS